MSRRGSLTHAVAAFVAARGAALLDDVQAKFTERNRAQLQKALENAKRRKLIRLARRGRGGPGKRDGGLWEAIPAEPEVYGAGAGARPPASVFELAAARAAGNWPPAGIGRQFRPLGDWNSTEDRHA